MKKIIFASILAVLLFVITTKSYAVFVTPQFVVFENNNTARITLNNRANKPKVITFEWQRRYFDGNQNVQILADDQNTYAHYLPADPYIKFSPRRVILRPFESQTIRLIVSRPQDMPQGEFRTQFIIKEQDLIDKSKTTAGGAGVTGVLTVNVNTGIPIFVRNGKTNVDFSIKNLQTVTQSDGKFLNLILQNNSTRTLYSDAYVACTNAEEDAYVGSIRGMVERRTITESFPLTNKNLSNCANPTLKIIGVRDREYGNKVVLEQAFTL